MDDTKNSLAKTLIEMLPFFLVDRIRRRRYQATEDARLRDEAEAERVLQATSWEDARARAGDYSDELLNRFRVDRRAVQNIDG